MPDVSRERAHRAWINAERIKRLSDRLIGIGPIGLGLDGVLAWVPGANLIYSLGAGGLLVFEAVQVRASAATLARMTLYIAANSAMTEVPILGWAMDTLFPGHLMAANALQKDIEVRYGRPAAAQRTARRGWRFWETPRPFGTDVGGAGMRDVTPGRSRGA